jgi:hypothetical protein
VNNYLSTGEYLYSNENTFHVSNREQCMMNRNNIQTKTTNPDEIERQQSEMFNRIQAYQNCDFSAVSQSSSNLPNNSVNNIPIFRPDDIMTRLNDRNQETEQLHNIQYQSDDYITPPFQL